MAVKMTGSGPIRNVGALLVVLILVMGAFSYFDAQPGTGSSDPKGGSGSNARFSPFSIGAVSAPYNTTVSCQCTNITNGSSATPVITTAPSGSGSNGSAGPLCLPCGTYIGHYGAYAAWAGSVTTATAVYATITLPWSGPRYGDYYAELLSSLDNSGHEDQIGVISDYTSLSQSWATGMPAMLTDDWGVEWDYLPSCGYAGGSYVFGTDWGANVITLAPGGTYTMEMDLSPAAGNLVMYVHSGGVGGTILWQRTFWPHARWFNTVSTTSCGGQNAPGLDVLQEPYILQIGNFPSWNFNFTGVHAGYGTLYSWTTATFGYPKTCFLCTGSYSVPTSLHNYYVTVNILGDWASMANNAFDPVYPGGAYSATPGWYTQTVLMQALGPWCLYYYTCYVMAAVGTGLTGWSFNSYFTSTWTVPNNGPSWGILIPTSATINHWYYIGGQWGYSPTVLGAFYEWSPEIVYVYVT